MSSKVAHRRSHPSYITLLHRCLSLKPTHYASLCAAIAETKYELSKYWRKIVYKRLKRLADSGVIHRDGLYFWVGEGQGEGLTTVHSKVVSSKRAGKVSSRKLAVLRTLPTKVTERNAMPSKRSPKRPTRKLPQRSVKTVASTIKRPIAHLLTLQRRSVRKSADRVKKKSIGIKNRPGRKKKETLVMKQPATSTKHQRSAIPIRHPRSTISIKCQKPTSPTKHQKSASLTKYHKPPTPTRHQRSTAPTRQPKSVTPTKQKRSAIATPPTSPPSVIIPSSITSLEDRDEGLVGKENEMKKQEGEDKYVIPFDIVPADTSDREISSNCDTFPQMPLIIATPNSPYFSDASLTESTANIMPRNDIPQEFIAILVEKTARIKEIVQGILDEHSGHETEENIGGRLLDEIIQPIRSGISYIRSHLIHSANNEFNIVQKKVEEKEEEKKVSCEAALISNLNDIECMLSSMISIKDKYIVSLQKNLPPFHESIRTSSPNFTTTIRDQKSEDEMIQQCKILENELNIRNARIMELSNNLTLKQSQLAEQKDQINTLIIKLNCAKECTRKLSDVSNENLEMVAKLGEAIKEFHIEKDKELHDLQDQCNLMKIAFENESKISQLNADQKVRQAQTNFSQQLSSSLQKISSLQSDLVSKKQELEQTQEMLHGVIRECIELKSMFIPLESAQLKYISAHTSQLGFVRKEIWTIIMAYDRELKTANARIRELKGGVKRMKEEFVAAANDMQDRMCERSKNIEEIHSRLAIEDDKEVENEQ